jgi:hypothetical protein
MQETNGATTVPAVDIAGSFRQPGPGAAIGNPVPALDRSVHPSDNTGKPIPILRYSHRSMAEWRYLWTGQFQEGGQLISG